MNANDIIRRVMDDLDRYERRDLDLTSLFGAGMTLQNGIWAPPAPPVGQAFRYPLAWDVSNTLLNARANPAPPKPVVPGTASPLWDKPETVTEEIIAYRGWTYDFGITAEGEVEVLLESLFQNFYWKGPVTTADAAPTAENQHGLYAVGGGKHHEHNFDTYVKDGCDASVWGRVALSGTVVEGTKGYRAERATIQELWVNPTAEDRDEIDLGGLCKALERRYQCDCSIRAPKWADIQVVRA